MQRFHDVLRSFLYPKCHRYVAASPLDLRRDRYAAEARGLVYPLEIVSAGLDQAFAERAVREEASFSHLHPALQLVVRESLVPKNLNLFYFVARPFNNAEKNCLAVWCGLNIGLHRY